MPGVNASSIFLSDLNQRLHQRRSTLTLIKTSFIPALALRVPALIMYRPEGKSGKQKLPSFGVTQANLRWLRSTIS